MTDDAPEEKPEPETPPPILSEDGVRRMLQQAFDLWIAPEVEKRKAAGTLPEPFHLYMAQRIQHPDGTITVRFNDEVRGVAKAKAMRPITTGDQLVLSDLEHLTEFDVPDDELDCGHWTIIRTGEKWFTSFNFLSIEPSASTYCRRLSSSQRPRSKRLRKGIKPSRSTRRSAPVS